MPIRKFFTAIRSLLDELRAIRSWDIDARGGAPTSEQLPDNPFINLPRGSKPYSVYLSGYVCRYSRTVHTHVGENFWRNFEDGPWKWETPFRFAGAGVNPGHFFALSFIEAQNELLHYLKSEAEMEHYTSILLFGSIDNILDLTSIKTIEEIAIREWGCGNNAYSILGELVSAKTGGSPFTDAFGAYAYERGYSGILFYSARNQESSTDREIMTSDRFYREDDELIFKSFSATSMFEVTRNRCIVIFKGADVIRSTRKYNINHKTYDNPLFGRPHEDILLRSEKYGETYQNDCRDNRRCPKLLQGSRRCLRLQTSLCPKSAQCYFA